MEMTKTHYRSIKAEVKGYYIGRGRKGTNYEKLTADLEIPLKLAHKIVCELQREHIIKPM